MSGFGEMIAFRERGVAECFRRAGAIGPATARAPSELGLEISALQSLRSRGMLRDGELGRLYLDEESFAAIARARRMALMALAISAAGVILVVWGLLRRR
ncbi:MAG: hypothetical protein ABIZ70_04370 [Gemmatimonadales bacterium]